MSDIFLSYSSKDRERIRPLEKALEAQGWTVFWDRDIPVGKTWRSFIGEEIQNCLCIVVVWTKNSVQSEWVIEEAEEGKARRILFPVSLDGVRPPFGFGSIQSADLSDWEKDSDHRGYNLLVQELDNHIEQIREQARLDKERKEKEKAKAEQEKIARQQREAAEKERLEQARVDRERQEREKAKAEQEKIALPNNSTEPKTLANPKKKAP